MPMWVPGSSAARRARAAAHAGPRSRHAPRRAAAGFTLLEMLVVLVIAGIVIGTASLSLTRNPRADLDEQGRRLALLFESAGDEAQVRARPIAWQPQKDGYRFAERVDGRWRPLRDNLFRPRKWDPALTGVTIRFAGTRDSATQIVFGLESIEVPVVVTLYSPSAQVSVVGTGTGRFEVH